MTPDDFMQAILAEPDDDSPRLIFADWLEEQGDLLQAAFIRAQCALARLTPNTAEFKEALNHEVEQRIKYSPIWGKSLPEWTSYLRIRLHRGFGGIVFTTIPYFLKHANKLFKSYPIQRAEFGRGEPYLERLLRCPHLTRLREIEIDYCDFRPESYQLLANCPHLNGLAFMALRRATNMSLSDANLLVRSPHLKRLTAIHCPDVDPSVQEELKKRFQLSMRRIQ